MILVALCLQASLLAHPLYLEEQRPQLRSAQHVLLFHDELDGLAYPVGRKLEETQRLMTSLRLRIEAGENFGEVAKVHSNARTARFGGSLGSYPQGLLKPDFDEFLFGAEMNELSAVLTNNQGVHLLRRVPTYAALMQIQLDGTQEQARALAGRILARLEAGTSFAELAKEHSVEPISREHGGMYRVFERGSHDTLLKRAAFEAPLGRVFGPVKTPVGYHILQRVETDAFPQELWDNNFMRVSGILISHLKALAAPASMNRTQTEAKALAEEVIQRVKDGEAFAVIAARFNDDPGGKERAGDLGWVHRENPDLPAFYSSLFLAKPGTVSKAILTPVGVVVLIRDK